jgi:hypothetical protein
VAQPKTKVRIKTSVAKGEARPIVHQIPTPVIAPKTTVSSTKNRVWRYRYAR